MSMFRRHCRPLIVAIAATFATTAVALPVQAEPSVHEFALDNGMKVLVKPDSRAPVVVSQLWFPVGSSHERPGETGISHILEHMMFKGTENRETGEFSRTISREGGRLNAFTGRDFTGYYEELQADRLEVALELEADRLANIRFDENEFEREMEVVREERRQRVDDNPLGLGSERFNALAWATSAYRQPIIGWAEDLDSITLDDVRDWYEKFYGVNNATLVVVGDVDPEAVHDLARKHFGPLEPRPAPEARSHGEIEGLGERRARLRIENATPFLLMGYHVPSLATADDSNDSHALSLLASILDGGKSARLPQRLVRDEEVASSVSAGYRGVARLDTQFTLSGRPPPAGSLDDLEQALRTEVERIIDEGVSEEELERARIQARADYVYRMDSLSSQAMQIGLLETTGIGWEVMDTFEEAIAAVTREDIQSVAERYLVDNRLTVVHIEPRGEISPMPIPGQGPADTPTPPNDTGY